MEGLSLQLGHHHLRRDLDHSSEGCEEYEEFELSDEDQIISDVVMDEDDEMSHKREMYCVDRRTIEAVSCVPGCEKCLVRPPMSPKVDLGLGLH